MNLFSFSNIEERSETNWFSELKIPFETAKQSKIAQNTLQPDPILRPADIDVKYSTEEEILVIKFDAVSDRVLRVAISSVLESLKTVIETIDEFEGKFDEYLQ
ncbi:L antigen family member 3 [Wickerhamomyces ciferrii]|uniref:L antigen family member 3 n=1 Tax=Wickerhamomyces ciferrii (strain ATCC 14091 / BCRC 22168 / CBS 111 / JCM 3599 / NBRC 0793 / NRRL Y-1031 F-60-10) TaxID=1206466 RepID=K0KR96_WICCF|nr:L antigen family member 3 [Wickerhamomyces ciferrii]CCH43823.1 L antigen family member 3 [Wickerhamomyces ciferrii]